MKKIVPCFIIMVLLLSGCATTTGPRVSSFEVRQAEERLKAKAVRHKYDQLQRVSDIGYRIVKNLPLENGTRSYPYIGLNVVKITDIIQGAYAIDDGATGVVAVTVAKGSPAERAGISAGDIIEEIDGSNIRNETGFNNATSYAKLKDKERIDLRIKRQGVRSTLSCDVERVPRQVSFDMVDDQSINAGASYDKVAVTYGMMKFITSDDEIAVVLGHEFAHITRGHIAKSTGVQMLAGLAVIGLGVISENIQPGSGTEIMRAASGASQIFSRSYSRDLEREADYFGLQYTKSAGYDYTVAIDLWERFAVEVPKSMVENFLNTHPTSPERLVRLEKIIEELRSE
ncbi:MAG: M48 family metalloprotease [Candidatus Omnitrophica bacterium]|nr:M48 family metalloprotease [Candidatus Omnitrophota bacterium]